MSIEKIRHLERTQELQVRAVLAECIELIGQYVQDQGGCDHAVGLCVCGEMRVLESAQEALAILDHAVASDIWTLAKSRCACGHTGDGEHSQHAGANGHGHCERCECSSFTWAGFLPTFEAWLGEKVQGGA
jgi:hypothetical protein